jgi:hypothetical protein
LDRHQRRLAFTGVVNQGATKGILYDARRSLPTFVLVMCVSALYSSPETRENVLAYTSSLSRLALLHLLLIEPVLTFLSIYVMVIALEKQRSTDFTLVMVLVQGNWRKTKVSCVKRRRDSYNRATSFVLSQCCGLCESQRRKRPVWKLVHS